MSERAEIIKQYMVLPTGMPIDHHEAHAFALIVEWRGNKTEDGAGGYAVKHGSQWLSRAGNWAWPERYQFRQYRWNTFEEALEKAREAVDKVTVNRYTFAQWEERFPASGT
jgi:hypothetical protein